MEVKKRKDCCVRLYKVIIYLIGLIGTCYGVAIILVTNWGPDAWNGVFAGLEKLTSLSVGIWSIMIQACFWVSASILKKKADWLCVIPILLKGVFLDIAIKTVISISFKIAKKLLLLQEV